MLCDAEKIAVCTCVFKFSTVYKQLPCGEVQGKLMNIAFSLMVSIPGSGYEESTIAIKEGRAKIPTIPVLVVHRTAPAMIKQTHQYNKYQYSTQ